MAKSEQQHQKKLAKKRAKDKQKQRVLAQRRQAMTSLSGQMQWASAFPIHRCYISDDIFGESGMGVIFLTRAISDGRIAMMFLLIDAHCLGVKDAGAQITTPAGFDRMFERSQTASSFSAADPARARKLTEDAIAYAQSIGFPPHPDYRKVAPLWADIDPAACTEEFKFGLDGKPSYVAGPNDDAARQNLIFRRLCETVGEGNFHFTLGGPAGGTGFNFDELGADELRKLELAGEDADPEDDKD